MSVGHYSVIQYCPDRARAEVANVGVVLMVPDRGYIKARTAREGDRDRASSMFQLKGARLDQLNAAKRAFESRFEVERTHFRAVEDLVRFAATRGNELLLTPPRSVRVDDPDAELVSLFKDLVGGRRPRKESPPRLRELDELFARLVALKTPNVQIGQSFAVAAYDKVKADYAYRNGALNLVRVQAFETEKDLRIAARLGAEGLLIGKHGIEQQPAKEIVVSSTSSPLEARVRSLLQENFGVEFIPHVQVPEFAARVEKDAH